MNKVIYSGTAQVEIQGRHVFEFISIDGHRAEYEIIGITNPVIRVMDFRSDVRHKMEDILRTKRVEQLADCFNRPAKVTILPPQAGQMIVQLKETHVKKPHHMLWVAIGIGEDIPMYDYKKVEIQQMDDGNFALFSLYKRPRSRVKAKLA